MQWRIKSTDTFRKSVKKHKSNRDLLSELDKKLKRLKYEPETIGGMLSGKLHGKKSTRLTQRFRLIFSTDSNNKIVYLIALDHRRTVY